MLKYEAEYLLGGGERHALHSLSSLAYWVRSSAVCNRAWERCFVAVSRSHARASYGSAGSASDGEALGCDWRDSFTSGPHPARYSFPFTAKQSQLTRRCPIPLARPDRPWPGAAIALDQSHNRQNHALYEADCLLAALALRYVEDPINRWLHWVYWRFARFAGYADSFLIVFTRYLGTGISTSAVPLGAGYFRSAQLSCGG